MTSRRLFLISLSSTLPFASCASVPPDATRRKGGVADPKTAPPAAWRPEAEGPSTPAKPASTPAITADHYTCTMHPEVMLPTPGACPKCGMPLVLKKGGSVK